MQKFRLTIELVPKTCWFTNVRSAVTAPTWDKLRHLTASKAGHLCEICGGRGKRWPVESHERFSYDDKNHVQKLEGLIALCPPCHEVKHIGLAQMRGRKHLAMRHFCKINGVDS